MHASTGSTPSTRRWRLALAAMATLLAAPLAQAYDGTPHPISRTEGASQVQAVAAGRYHSCALQALVSSPAACRRA